MDDDTGRHRSGAEAAREDAQRASRESRTAERRRGRRGGVDPASFRDAILAKLTYSIGKDPAAARDRDWFTATALAVRDHVIDRWMNATRATYLREQKRVYYLSLEFLIGRLLFEALGNLGLLDTAREALAGLDVDFDESARPNRTRRSATAASAACRLLHGEHGEPRGAGLRLRHPLRLRPVPPDIIDGWQHELPEDWLADGNPWEFERPEVVYPIRFGGSVEHVAERRRHKRSLAPGGDRDRGRLRYAGGRLARPPRQHASPVVGARRRSDPARRLQRGRLCRRARRPGRAEAISRVLYPSDATPAGQELRLRQEYFFTSASLQDLVRRHLHNTGP